MITMVTFDRTKETSVDVRPARGKNKASTKMPTIGPDMAPITLTHIFIRKYGVCIATVMAGIMLLTLRMPPRGSAVKASSVEKTPKKSTDNWKKVMRKRLFHLIYRGRLAIGDLPVEFVFQKVFVNCRGHTVHAGR